jgi:DNA-binding NtrC family response regulator/tetratricopeptide (TPR) repeat protein
MEPDREIVELAGLVGESPGIVAVRDTIHRLVPRLAETHRSPPILIQGETGTGKGLLARAIHRASARRAGPFVDVNCAAIPETMLEAELFGFERGAFTDARHAKAGLFQAAHHGTLFLDELGLLPGVLQGKLLTVLEERVVRRLGSTRGEPVDVWVIAATSADIAAAMRAGRFHDALYHRLSVLTVWLPPLRERGGDILLLAEHFLSRACQDHGLPPRRIDPRARATLLAYPWPGNVRELGNVMERVALLTDGPVVTAEMLGLGALAPAVATPEPAAESAGRLRDRVAGLERDQIASALRQTRGNVTHAAARLGIPVNTLRYRIQKLGLAAGAPRARPATPRRVPVSAPVPAAVASGVVRWQSRRVALLQVTLDAEASAPEATRALEAVVAKVQSFGGRVEELAPGCVVGAFGIEAVEDAARRAAHAARAIHAAFTRARAETGAPWSARLGLHVAPFLVGEAGGAAVLDVATKRRASAALDLLVAAAEPGTTLVSADAVPFLDRRFELVPVRAGDGSVAYRLVDTERTGFGIRGRLVPFVGRAAALDALRERLATARAGRGQAVVVGGDAGIGKSRLLHELRQHASLHGVRALEGRCVSYGRPVAYLPFADVLRQVCGIGESDDGATVERKIEHALTAVGLDRRRGAALLGVLGRGEGAADDEPRTVRARTFDAIQQLLVGASWQRPVVLAIEDLHWSDPTSEELLGSLIASLSNAAILVVVTHRSGYRPPWPTPPDALEITLDPLSHDESLQVLRAVLETDAIPDTAVEAILARGDGNPFFLEELARALVENPALGTAGPVPATIQEVLLSRMARLAAEDQRVLQTAAVIGKDVPWALVHALAPLDPDALRGSLTRLCAGQFLREGMASEEPGHTFAHALTQEVAYGTLAADERRALHAAAVEAIERAYAGRLDERRDQLAHHVARGEVWSKAMTYFRASLDLSMEDVSAAWRAGEHARVVARSLDDLRVAHEFKNLLFQIEIQLRLGRALHSLGDYRKAIEVLRRNTDQLGDDTPETSPARVAALLSWVWLALAHAEIGEAADAQRCATQALAAAETVGDAYARAAAPWAAGLVALHEGAVEGALSWLTLARDASRGLGAADIDPPIAAALGVALARAGRHDEATATLSAAVADAEAKGLKAHHALRLAWWAEAERLAGRLEEAETLGNRALETARRHGERGHEAWALLALARVATARGDARAEVLNQEALTLAESLGMRPLLARIGAEAISRLP